MSSICSAAATTDGPSSAGSALRTRWRPAPSNSAPTVVNSIGSTAVAATPPPSSHRISPAARCGFSPKTPVPISPSFCSIRSASARLPQRAHSNASHGRFFNPDYQDDFNYLTRQSRGDLTVTGISQDRRQWIVAYQYDDAPLEYFHYDRAARQMKRLFSAAPAWEGLPFVTMEPVIIRARDGLELLCYLSRP